MLRDLPTGNNVFAVPETIQLETISDLFSAGGLNTATAPKIGGLLNSWTQTQYRIGDVSITDPRAGGTPLLLPFLPLWSARDDGHRRDGARRQRVGRVDRRSSRRARARRGSASSKARCPAPRSWRARRAASPRSIA